MYQDVHLTSLIIIDVQYFHSCTEILNINFSSFQLVSVAEQLGRSLVRLQKPETIFSWYSPNYMNVYKLFHKLQKMPHWLRKTSYAHMRLSLIKRVFLQLIDFVTPDGTQQSIVLTTRHGYTFGNSLDPDQLASFKNPTDQDPHCFRFSLCIDGNQGCF